MLHSQFFVDDDRYVIPAKNIVEIVPCMPLKAVPMLPDYATGIMNYHGDQLPVVDLCQLLINRPCRKKLSTRIIIVDCKVSTDAPIKLGFMVEKATEIITIDEGDFKPSAMNNPESPIGGMIAIYEGMLVTKISIIDVLDKLDERIFHPVNTIKNKVAK